MNPYKLLQSINNKPVDWRPQWADHLSVKRGAGTTVYISEPYMLFPEAFRDFELLEVHGWRVVVDGESKHNPGRTVRIRITEVAS